MHNYHKTLGLVIALLIILTAACQPIQAPANSASAAAPDDNIVLSIVSAPTVSNGLVADQPTSINVLLTAPTTEDRYASDPAHFGHQIPAGGWLEVEFGGTFIRNGVDNDQEFVPINANAHLILLTGNPQNIIAAVAGVGTQHGSYTIEDNGAKTLTVRPNGGEGENGLEGQRAQVIGLKTIYVAPKLNSNVGPAPFQNGAAGTEGTVAVRIYGANGTLREQGEAAVTFPATVGRQVFTTNFGLFNPLLFSADVNAELVEATNFQHVAPGTQLTNTVLGETFTASAPYAPRFLLVEAMDAQPDPYYPMLGIANVGLVVDADNPARASLVQDTNEDGVLGESDETIGEATISGPNAESPGQILASADAPLTDGGNGVDLPAGGILNVPVALGSSTGIYTVTVTLSNGSEATIFLVAEE
ncbi:MAG: hypothetical protein R3C14_10330 [Caldilineaceae bacterium]